MPVTIERRRLLFEERSRMHFLAQAASRPDLVVLEDQELDEYYRLVMADARMPQEVRLEHLHRIDKARVRARNRELFSKAL